MLSCCVSMLNVIYFTYYRLKFFNKDADAGEKYKGQRDAASLEKHIQDTLDGPKAEVSPVALLVRQIFGAHAPG